jgi:predicted TIM-barrel fold metal-dependent hydrolase
MIDYWCNAFTPDREVLWNSIIERDELAIRLGAKADDAFTAADEMVARMDRLDIATLVIPFCDLPDDAPLDDFVHYAARSQEIVRLADAHPGRFVGMLSINPDAGTPDHELAAATLAEDWCVALHNHTHSWDRTFDHPDFDPYYALCAEQCVPFVMQAGASGGDRVHESGHPGAIAEPAQRFPDVDFVLSHTGAPWVEETIVVAAAHDNVVIGTATHPPRHWPDELVDFIRGPGADQVLLGTGYPLTGHGHILGQLDDLDFDGPTRQALVEGNTRRLFSRIPDRVGG